MGKGGPATICMPLNNNRFNLRLQEKWQVQEQKDDQLLHKTDANGNKTTYFNV